MIAGRMGGENQSVWLESLDSTANLNDYVNLNKYYDNIMLLSCLFQSDVMGTSEKGSYALGETQADMIGRNVTSICNLIQNTLLAQVVKPMLQINFNEQENFGEFIRGDNVAEDVALNMDKINTCINQGIKLKGTSIIQLLDLHEDMVESYDAPIPDTSQESQSNNGVNSNFRRAQ